MKHYKIGETLHAFRTKNGMTIKQLSEKTGLSTALISEMERGIGNPTLAVLETLADTMGISLAMLLERDISNASLVRRKADRAQNEEGVYDVLAVSPVRSRMELELMELLPGRQNPESGMSIHPAYEEIAYVIDGQVQVLFEQEEDGFFTGHIPEYCLVKAKGENLHNEVLPVKITGFEGETLLGEVMA